ncbi:MAG: EAL domain-containing protein [Gammaproteobacteria bacterium]|nr:EAL domain-containing protein [Gammaproteobacteria bacterium]
MQPLPCSPAPAGEVLTGVRLGAPISLDNHRFASDDGQQQLNGVIATLAYRHGAVVSRFRDYELATAFQPIVSFAHQRPVGCEALVRAKDTGGDPVAPGVLFDSVTRTSDSVLLDRLCRGLHVANFRALGDQDWLFLNVNPRVVSEGPRHGSFFRDLLDHFGIAPHQVVIELLETAITNEQALTETVDYYRDLGCMLALDDFGAGHSNFDRIWRLQPEIIKLDRQMLADATRIDVVRRSLPNLVALLHEAGCIVLAEGIETEDEALVAMEAGVDLAQGYLFGRPAPISAPAPLNLAVCHEVLQRFRDNTSTDQRRDQLRMAGYIGVFNEVARHIGAGAEPAAVVDDLFALPAALRFYLLDGDGAQTGHNFIPVLQQRSVDRRLRPLAQVKGANWYHRSYFRKALQHPGEVQITSPYLSLPDATMCVTLSTTVTCCGELRVLCLDLAVPGSGAA